MNGIVASIIFSLLPISELRVGIPVAIANGINPFLTYGICVAANILIIPFVFFFLDYLHKFFMKIKLYNALFNKHIEKSRVKIEKHIGTKWEFIVLVLFVGIPLPITGAYTGTLLAWFFYIDRKKAYLALVSGIIISGVIVTLISVLGIKAFSLL